MTLFFTILALLATASMALFMVAAVTSAFPALLAGMILFAVTMFLGIAGAMFQNV